MTPTGRPCRRSVALWRPRAALAQRPGWTGKWLRSLSARSEPRPPPAQSDLRSAPAQRLRLDHANCLRLDDELVGRNRDQTSAAVHVLPKCLSCDFGECQAAPFGDVAKRVECSPVDTQREHRRGGLRPSWDDRFSYPICWSADKRPLIWREIRVFVRHVFHPRRNVRSPDPPADRVRLLTRDPKPSCPTQ